MKRILLFADGFRIPTNQRKRSRDLRIGFNSVFTGKAFSYMLLFVLLLFSTENYGQCPYPGGTTQVGSAVTFCIDNPAANTISGVVNNSYVVFNVVQGFSYTFSVNNIWGDDNEVINIYNDTSPSASLGNGSNGNGVSVNYTAAFSGAIRILVNRVSCGATSTGTNGTLTITLTGVNNTNPSDNQLSAGTDSWIGHVYNLGGFTNAPATQASNLAMFAPNALRGYAGYYTESENFGLQEFGGNTVCFPLLANGVNRTNIYTETFAVRYRMRSTRPAGCYLITIRGDDGTKLYVNGASVAALDQWTDHGVTTYANVIVNFPTNSTDLVFDYYENTVNNRVSFSIVPYNQASNTITPLLTQVCSGVATTIRGSYDSDDNAGTTPNTNSSFTFSWEINTNGTGWTTISGATGLDYSPPAITTTTNNVVMQYRRTATPVNASCSATVSDPVTITTSPVAPAQPGTISGTAVQCPAVTGQVYSIAAVTNALSYTWAVPTGWSITSGQGTNSITVTTGTAGQNGNVSVTATNGCGTSGASTLVVTVNSLPAATTVRPITFVSFNEIQNTSSDTTAYEDFTTSVSSANVSRGSSFTLGVRGNTGTSNTHYFSAYFDWNQDGDFADSGEYVEIGTIRDSYGTENNKLASVYFPVPVGATLGLTRMRVISSSGGYSATDGCSINSSTGQAEDYLINIADLCSGTPVPGTTASTSNPVCPNTPFTLSFSNPVVNGVQYTWESSLNGSSWSGSSANPINFFNTDFSTAPAYSNVYGTNATITGGELILTLATGGLYGGFKIQKTLASAGLPSINAFTTKFKYRAFDGSGADGISLSYGASLGNNAGPGEEGEGSGLRLCLDTYDNDGGNTGSRVRIYYNNSFIFQNRIGSYDLRNAAYREVVLSVSNSGFLTLTIGGTTIVSGLSLPSYTAADKSNWNFKFSARTGGQNDKQSIDDVDIKYLDILTSNVLFTTQQTVATYYRVRATCSNGGAIGYSTALLVNVDPVAPIIGTITQPTCALATGSVALSGLPSSGSWTITATPATSGLTGLGGTGDSTIIGGLTANTSYTFMVSNVTCSSIASASAVINPVPVTATWNGSFWTGTASGTTSPLITQPIVFAGNYSSSGDINGCSCTVTSGNVVMNSGHTMTITNAVNVTNNASTSLVFNDKSSLVQTTNATNTGAIEYRRISSPMKNFDYTYWSSPVWGDGTIVPKQTAKNLSPNTLADKYFRFDPSTVEGWVFYDGEMTPGVGFIIRVPKPGSPAPDNWSGSIYPQPVAFKGVPNNGDYSFAVGSNQLNLIGNPYPSALDADLFMTNLNNANMINGALYFWTHKTAISQSGSNYVYTADDYATYTLTGGVGTGVGTSPSGIAAPTRYIGAGQSFFVENAAAGSFQFTNAMRVAGNNSKFFKQANTKKTATVEKNRVWLNLTNSGGAFKQLLVGYITGATNDWDNLYDGPSFDGQEFVDFYSVNQGKNLTIQGRALPFVDTDVVPLGYRSTIAGPFDISIDNRDGSLAGQAIWLEDKKTNTLHELSKGKYTFTAINGVENDRFVLKYTGKTLGTDDNEVADKSLIVSVKNKKITLTSSAEAITQVQLFDLLGRKVYDKSKINAQEWSISNLPSSEQTLIVKTTLANGAISNKKIIY